MCGLEGGGGGWSGRFGGGLFVRVVFGVGVGGFGGWLWVEELIVLG